ncbi:MAG: CheR family methyltransferase [Spirochaetota bacterium]
MSELVDITDEEFARITTLVHTRFGIDLSKKRTLIRGRLNGTLRSLGYRSFADYMEEVDRDATGGHLLDMIDRLSTNHTFFFREADHLDYLTTTALPALWNGDAERGLRDGRIWCAGCATGEEPYSILIALADHYGLESLPAHPLILATDISSTALAIAQRAVYPVARVREAGDIVKRGYAVQETPTEIRIKESIRRRVLFKRLNLMRHDFPFRNKFDVVFCRNVMIYFDQPTRRALVEAFRRHLLPGGYLFLGHSESMGRNVNGYEYLRPAVYRRSM